MGFPTKAGGGILGIIVAAGGDLPAEAAGRGSQARSSTGRSATATVGAPRTCTAELEQILCGAANDVQEYWTPLYPQAFGGRSTTTTDTVFFTGSSTPAAARPPRRSGPFYCPADELVYFDLDFLTQLQKQFGAAGDLAAQYIVAHEYGHHVQNVLGIEQRGAAGCSSRTRSQANQYSVALELQADCFAGAWAKTPTSAAARAGRDLDEALNAAAAVGDDRIQEQTQGCGSTRRVHPRLGRAAREWFRRGYDTGDPQRCTTFAASCRQLSRRGGGRPTRAGPLPKRGATAPAATMRDDPEAGGEQQRRVEPGRADQPSRRRRGRTRGRGRRRGVRLSVPACARASATARTAG